MFLRFFVLVLVQFLTKWTKSGRRTLHLAPSSAGAMCIMSFVLNPKYPAKEMSISEFIATFAQFYGLTSESSQPVCPKKSNKEVSTLQRLMSNGQRRAKTPPSINGSATL